MNFLEKNLEDIIWDNTQACFDRGLKLNHYELCEGENLLRLRQPALHPYGIADLVNIYFSPFNHDLCVQVIECKKGAINLETYTQAKRYETAFRHFLASTIEIVAQNGGAVTFETVLVGATFDAANEFAYLYNSDLTCTAYTFTYDVDGIGFHQVCRGWQRQAGPNSCLESVRSTVHSHIREALTRNVREMDEHEAFNLKWERERGNWRSPLLITASGVLLNYDLIGRDTPIHPDLLP